MNNKMKKFKTTNIKVGLKNIIGGGEDEGIPTEGCKQTEVNTWAAYLGLASQWKKDNYGDFWSTC